jgi:hypothetical protein
MYVSLLIDFRVNLKRNVFRLKANQHILNNNLKGQGDTHKHLANASIFFASKSWLKDRGQQFSQLQGPIL